MRSPTRHRRASVLLLVLVLVVLLTFASTGLFSRMAAEHRGVRTRSEHLQSKELAASGVSYVRALLTPDPVELQNVGGLFDNHEHLRGVIVLENE